jgi:RecB family exonuclease
VIVTPRSTRLVRAAGLQAFRDAVVSLAVAGDPAEARDRLVIVPTRAAGSQLLRTIEDTLLPGRGALLLPDLITPGELVAALTARLDPGAPLLADAEREVLLGVACRSARDAGHEPPFRLRPGLIAEALRFYDALRRQQKDVDTFERLALGALEPGAAYDRGAERLVRQTRFLVAAFRDFETRLEGAGVDEHTLRRRLTAEAAARPCRDIVLTVTDRSCDRYGLWAADWDLLTRLPGLETLTIVVTDSVLAGALHERLHDLLPGVEEVRFVEEPAAGEPAVAAPRLVGGVQLVRDREEEVVLFARRVKQAARAGPTRLDRHALVMQAPLPYVYVAREVLRGAGIPCQTFDTLPLAAEPYAAAVDLVLSAVSSDFGPAPSLALLQSPQFDFSRPAEAGHYVPEVDVEALQRELMPLATPGPMAERLDGLLTFLTRHERRPGPATVGAAFRRPITGDSLQARQVRARSAILGILTSLRDAYARFDASPVDLDALAGLVRRWIDAKTFAPHPGAFGSGDAGVHLVDAESARFGSFDHVHLAGLVDGEWPSRPHRNIFYSPAILRDLGWPQESARADATRAAFVDLLRLPASRLVVSTFSLEADALVTPSPLLDEIERGGLEAIDEPPSEARIFEHEALARDPIETAGLSGEALLWAGRRIAMPDAADLRFRGQTAGHVATGYSLSGLERYQDCPFKFFAAEVLRLQEPAEDESTLSPRARGRFIHEVFQRFFEAWDTRGRGTLAPDCLDEARELFREVAGPLLERLPEADAALERTRLFGSAISVGIVDVVLGMEASRPVAVKERWLEYRLEGDFALTGDDAGRLAAPTGGRRVRLRGVADRIDLLEGRRLRVIDYKSGTAPNTRRALQVPIYALCAQERLVERDRAPWAVDAAAYVAFSGKRSLAAVVKPGASDTASVLEDARERLFGLVEGIERGEFPPRPHDPMICRYCAYATVCRKDYVED